MSTPPIVMRANTDWLADLRSPNPTRVAALADLRAIIMAGLPYALVSWLPRSALEFRRP